MKTRFYVCGIGYDKNDCVTDYDKDFGDFDTEEEALSLFNKLQQQNKDSFFNDAPNVYQMLIQLEECKETKDGVECIDVKKEWQIINPKFMEGDIHRMKKLNVTCNCMAVYNSSIDVPDDMTWEEAIEYAREHIDDIPLGELDYVSDSDSLDEDNCYFDEEIPDSENKIDYTWKDIVEINGKIYAEEFPISGKMDNENTYQIDDFLAAVANKYNVDVDEIKTYMMDNIDFNAKELPFGAEDCGCYINGIAEWLRPEQTVENVYKRINIRLLCYELYKACWKAFHTNLDKELGLIRGWFFAQAENNCSPTVYPLKLYEQEFGYEGELHACFEEFIVNEYLDEDYITSLLDDNKLIELYYKDVKMIKEVKNG